MNMKFYDLNSFAGGELRIDTIKYSAVHYTPSKY